MKLVQSLNGLIYGLFLWYLKSFPGVGESRRGERERKGTEIGIKQWDHEREGGRGRGRRKGGRDT